MYIPAKSTFLPRRGYTLIEILVVISVISLIFLGGYAGYREFARRQILNRTFNDLRTDLGLSRQKALSGEKPEGFCVGSSISLEGYRVFLASNSYTISAKCSDGSRTTYKMVETPGVTLTTNGPTVFVFLVLGRGTDLVYNLEITLRQDVTGISKMLTVNPQGNVQ